MGPFPVVRAISDAYEVSLPNEMCMNSIFDVKKLSPSRGDNVPPIALPYDPSQNAPTLTDKVDIVLYYHLKTKDY